MGAHTVGAAGYLPVSNLMRSDLFLGAAGFANIGNRRFGRFAQPLDCLLVGRVFRRSIDEESVETDAIEHGRLGKEVRCLSRPRPVRSPGKVEARRHDLVQGPRRGILASALTGWAFARANKHIQLTKTPTWVGATSRPRQAAVGDANSKCGTQSMAAPGVQGAEPLPSILEPTSSVGVLWSRANASGNHPWIDGRGSNEQSE